MVDHKTTPFTDYILYIQLINILQNTTDYSQRKIHTNTNTNQNIHIQSYVPILFLCIHQHNHLSQTKIAQQKV